MTRRSAQARGFLFADLRGYTAFVEARGDVAAAELLRSYRVTVRRVIAQFDGAEVRTEGDSFYVVFPSASDAVLAGLAILDEAAASPADAPLRVGIGVHAGETTETDEGYVGWAVNIAARVCAAAGPGELFVTDTVRALTRGQVAFRFVPRGRRRLKGVAEPVAVYAVTSAEAPIPPRRSPVAGLRRLRRPVDRVALPLALAVGVLVLTAGVLVLIGPNLGGLAQETTSSPAAVSPSPGGQGASPEPTGSVGAESRDAAEQQLLARIQPDIARHCSSAPVDEAPEVPLGPANPGDANELVAPLSTEAGLRCSLGGGAGPDVVEYWQAIASTVPLDEAFFELAADRNVPEGDCAESTRAVGTWELGGTGGRLLCTAFGGEAFIAWTYDGEYIMALATRDDGDIDALLRWWESTQRLLAPESLTTDERGTAEQRLLGRIDPDVARHCSSAPADEAPEVVPRSGPRTSIPRSDREPAVTEAGLRCSLGGGTAPEAVQYWHVGTEQDLEDAFFLIAGDRNVPPGDCAVETRGEGRWEFGANGGRLLCTAFGGEALVAWTYDGETILGLATRSDGDIERLLDWWSAAARTLGP